MEPLEIENRRRRRQNRRASRPRSDPPPFYRLVYRVVRRVPRGKVVTYGQVAAILGQPRGARAVGVALGALRAPRVEMVPWHRVINAAGRCSHRDGFWADIQREHLEEEGVRFDRDGRVDLKTTRWTGPRREWVTRLRSEI
ncbi:MAG: methylated-DNA--[protein]-cysteine S-methyltransferase [Deltaproteobacteria bacterium]|nr:methylated-DNA--[protein]-cysteine S-methyltransferase [Deltaproteobacteria bacterium]